MPRGRFEDLVLKGFVRLPQSLPQTLPWLKPKSRERSEGRQKAEESPAEAEESAPRAPPQPSVSTLQLQRQQLDLKMKHLQQQRQQYQLQQEQEQTKTKKLQEEKNRQDEVQRSRVAEKSAQEEQQRLVLQKERQRLEELLQQERPSSGAGDRVLSLEREVTSPPADKAARPRSAPTQHQKELHAHAGPNLRGVAPQPTPQLPPASQSAAQQAALQQTAPSSPPQLGKAVLLPTASSDSETPNMAPAAEWMPPLTPPQHPARPAEQPAPPPPHLPQQPQSTSPPEKSQPAPPSNKQPAPQLPLPQQEAAPAKAPAKFKPAFQGMAWKMPAGFVPGGPKLPAASTAALRPSLPLGPPPPPSPGARGTGKPLHSFVSCPSQNAPSLVWRVLLSVPRGPGAELFESEAAFAAADDAPQLNGTATWLGNPDPTAAAAGGAVAVLVCLPTSAQGRFNQPRFP